MCERMMMIYRPATILLEKFQDFFTVRKGAHSYWLITAGGYETHPPPTHSITYGDGGKTDMHECVIFPNFSQFPSPSTLPDFASYALVWISVRRLDIAHLRCQSQNWIGVDFDAKLHLFENRSGTHKIRNHISNKNNNLKHKLFKKARCII